MREDKVAETAGPGDPVSPSEPPRVAICGRPFPAAALAVVSLSVGIAVAAGIAHRAGLIGAGAAGIGQGDPSWTASAVALAAIVAFWTFGAAALAIGLLRGRTGSTRFHPGWLKSAAAFGFGPALAALFFFILALTQGPSGMKPAAWVIGSAVMAAIFLARDVLAGIAERLLLALFVWLLILIAPVFRQDPVSEQFSGVLFAMLDAAGLVR